jgi:apolipoprotein D and lipocalin family protein
MKIASAPLAALCAALALAAAPAWAAAPQPAHPIAASFYSGTWYEIARTPNGNQKDCQAPTSQFAGGAGGKYEMVQICRKGSPSGAQKVWKSSGTIVPGSGNAKFKMKFLGLVNQEYWILDTAPDQSWAIMATPGGNYVWLMSRKAVMAPAAKAAALGRIKALGYNTAKLEQPRQPPA